MQRLCVLSALFVFSLAAQDHAAISGTVTDPSGALVGAAAVELKSGATGLRRSAATNEEGLYEITALSVGTYSITISKSGFKPTTVYQIDLQYGETRTIDAKLEVGGTSELVEVSAPAETV